MGCGASSEAGAKKAPAPKGFTKIKEIEMEETGIQESLDNIFVKYGEIATGLATMNNAIVDAHDKLVEAINELVESKDDAEARAELKENPRKFVFFAIKYLKDAGCELKLDGLNVSFSGEAQETVQGIIGAVEELVEAVKTCIDQAPEIGSNVADLVASATEVNMSEVMDGIKSKVGSNPMEIPKLLKKVKKNLCAVKDGPKTLGTVKDNAFALKNALAGN